MNLLISVILLCLTINVFAFDRFEYLSENNAPYNYQENGVAKGISIDILMEVFRVLDVDVAPTDIKFEPWARAYRDAQNSTKNNMIFTITRTPEREELFQWAGPFIYGRSVIFGRADAKAVKDLSELQGKKIGVIREDVSQLRLLKAGINKKDIIEVSTKDQLFLMLEKKRFDYFCHGELTTFHALNKSEKHSKQDVKVVYINDRGGLYFGFNKRVDKELVNQFKTALAAVLKDKEFMTNNIQNKYY